MSWVAALGVGAAAPYTYLTPASPPASPPNAAPSAPRSEMAGRNARDKTMLPQIKRALGEAQAQLAAAERQHSASTKAIHDREKLKRMAKF